MRDRHLQIIAERGRMAWQKASGYHWRALVEADISRFKRVIGDGRSRSSSACAARGIPAEGTIPHRRASRDRGRHRRERAEPNAGTRASGVRPHRVTVDQDGRAAAAWRPDSNGCPESN